MQSLDKDRPAQIRREAAERVAQAIAAERRSTIRLVVFVLVIGALVGFGAGVLVMKHWGEGRQVIFVPLNGTEV